MHTTETHHVQESTLLFFCQKVWQTLTDMVIELRKAQIASNMDVNNPQDREKLIRLYS